jgi:hypothetical protein
LRCRRQDANFLITDPSGPGVVLDDVSWHDAAKASSSWNAVSWSDDWNGAPWSDVSWED